MKGNKKGREKKGGKNQSKDGILDEKNQIKKGEKEVRIETEAQEKEKKKKKEGSIVFENKKIDHVNLIHQDYFVDTIENYNIFSNNLKLHCFFIYLFFYYNCCFLKLTTSTNIVED